MNKETDFKGMVTYAYAGQYLEGCLWNSVRIDAV